MAHPRDADASTPMEIREPADVERFADDTTLIDGPAGLVGVETEWLVVDVGNAECPVPPERTRAALAGLTLDSRLTFEPGGQLELSGPAAPLTSAIDALEIDLTHVRTGLADAGLRLAGLAADPLRAPRRFVDAPRYAAMAEYFATGGWPDGRLMMCSSTALQVNLDAGPASGWHDRWHLAHALGPVLIATFAASPVLHGTATGHPSTRQTIWAGIDPSRTGCVTEGANGETPARAWARYLLDARMLLVNDDQGGCRTVLDGSTFRDWVDGRGPVARRPTIDDLAYHSTTVFPQVRPRGWLELRYLDMLPADLWPVAVAVTTALLDDPAAATIAAQACEPVAGRWTAAAEVGLADRDLLRAAITCLEAALAALPGLGVGGTLLAGVETFAGQFTAAGRAPADDLLARWRRDGGAALLLDDTVNAAQAWARRPEKVR